MNLLVSKAKAQMIVFTDAIGADGSLFCIRRLHHAPPPHIIDDMYVSLMILCDGYRIVQAIDVRAYEESVRSASEEYRRKVRISCQAFNAHRVLWPRLRQLDALTLYQYISHKWIRWFSAYLLALAALGFVAAAIAAGLTYLAAALVIGVVAAVVLGHIYAVTPFAQLCDILTAFAGTGLGVWRAFLSWRTLSNMDACSVNTQMMHRAMVPALHAAFSGRSSDSRHT